MGEDDYELIYKIKNLQAGKNKNMRTEVVKEHLLERHRDKEALLSLFLDTQMYANYLDSLLEGL